MNWVNFHFESNQVFGMVDSPSQWRETKYLYHRAYGDKDIYELKESIPSSPLPNFGQRREHKGDRTLGDFFDQNRMTKI